MDLTQLKELLLKVSQYIIDFIGSTAIEYLVNYYYNLIEEPNFTNFTVLFVVCINALPFLYHFTYLHHHNRIFNSQYEQQPIEFIVKKENRLRANLKAYQNYLDKFNTEIFRPINEVNITFFEFLFRQKEKNNIKNLLFFFFRCLKKELIVFYRYFIYKIKLGYLPEEDSPFLTFLYSLAFVFLVAILSNFLIKTGMPHPSATLLKYYYLFSDMSLVNPAAMEYDTSLYDEVLKDPWDTSSDLDKKNNSEILKAKEENIKIYVDMDAQASQSKPKSIFGKIKIFFISIKNAIVKYLNKKTFNTDSSTEQDFTKSSANSHSTNSGNTTTQDSKSSTNSTNSDTTKQNSTKSSTNSTNSANNTGQNYKSKNSTANTQQHSSSTCIDDPLIVDKPFVKKCTYYSKNFKKTDNVCLITDPEMLSKIIPQVKQLKLKNAIKSGDPEPFKKSSLFFDQPYTNRYRTTVFLNMEEERKKYPVRKNTPQYKTYIFAKENGINYTVFKQRKIFRWNPEQIENVPPIIPLPEEQLPSELCPQRQWWQWWQPQQAQQRPQAQQQQVQQQRTQARQQQVQQQRTQVQQQQVQQQRTQAQQQQVQQQRTQAQQQQVQQQRTQAQQQQVQQQRTQAQKQQVQQQRTQAQQQQRTQQRRRYPHVPQTHQKQQDSGYRRVIVDYRRW